MAYLEPIAHEIKASRADLLGDLKRPEKRAAYLAVASQAYCVLGHEHRPLRVNLHWSRFYVG